MPTWFVCLTVLLGYVQGGQAVPPNKEQAQVASILTALNSDKVSRIEILQIPPRILYRTRVTPEVLEKDYYFKLTMRYVHDSDQFGRLVSGLKSMSVEPRSKPADLRWGVVFYSRDDTRIGALYFDQTGKDGAVDGTPVSFDGTLFKSIEDTFSNCFR